MKSLSLLFICISLAAFSQFSEDYAGQSTIAGTANGDRLSQAEFNNPHGLDIAPDGSIYIADRFSHSIRKIDTLGQVTLIAGTGTSGDVDGPASTAQFFEPWDISVGNNNEIYVADAKNNKIKLIKDGVVSTFAGTGNAGFTDNDNPLVSSFYWPSGVEFDHETGDLYIAGHLSHLIRKIDANGKVSTIAGSKLNFPNNYGSDDGIGTDATFYRPYGIHLDPKTRIFYIADEWNGLIRKMDENFNVTTIGGQPEDFGYVEGLPDTSKFNYPWDLTTDQTGNLYILDGYNHVIRKIDLTTNESSYFFGNTSTTGSANGTATQTYFNGATGIEYDQSDGCLYISDTYNNVIRRICLLENVSISASSDTICKNETVTLNASPTYYDQYEWYIDGSFHEKTTTPELSISFETTETIEVVGRRTGIGSKRSETTTVFVQDNGSVNITNSPTSPYCQGDSALLVVNTSNNSGKWSTNDTDSSIWVNQSDEYIFTLNDNSCGLIADTIDVVFNAVPLNPHGDNIQLNDDEFEIQNVIPTSPNEIVWLTYPDLIEVDEPAFYGDYVFFYKNEHGCLSDSTILEISLSTIINAHDDKLIVPPSTIKKLDLLANDETLPEMDITAMLPNVENVIFEVTNSGKLFVENNNPDLDSIVEFPYQICEKNNAQNCSEATVTVHLYTRNEVNSFGVFVPNAFTPNEDGSNDYFEIIGLSDANQDNHLEIYNRWGKLIFEQSNYENDWEGISDDGETLPEGVYYYILRVQKNTLNGYVLIERD